MMIGAANTIFKVAPDEIIAWVYIRWTWWLGPPTNEALWKSIGQNVATKHNVQTSETLFRASTIMSSFSSCWTHVHPWCTPSCTVLAIYSAANSKHSGIQRYHLLFFPLVMPSWGAFQTVACFLNIL